jgi:hypothetical protein
VVAAAAGGRAAGVTPAVLSFLEVGSLHEELHSEAFVLELAKRSPAGFKVRRNPGRIMLL